MLDLESSLANVNHVPSRDPLHTKRGGGWPVCFPFEKIGRGVRLTSGGWCCLPLKTKQHLSTMTLRVRIKSIIWVKVVQVSPAFSVCCLWKRDAMKSKLFRCIDKYFALGVLVARCPLRTDVPGLVLNVNPTLAGDKDRKLLVVLDITNFQRIEILVLEIKLQHLLPRTHHCCGGCPHG